MLSSEQHTTRMQATALDARVHDDAAAATPVEADSPNRLLTRAMQAERRQEERDKRPAQPQPTHSVPQLHSAEADPRQHLSEKSKQEAPQPLQLGPLAATAEPAVNSQTEPRGKSATRWEDDRQSQQQPQMRLGDQPDQSDSHRQRQRDHSQKVALQLQLQHQQEELRSYQQRMHQRALSREEELFRQEQRRMQPPYAAAQMHLKPSPHLSPMLYQPSLSGMPMQSQGSSSRSGASMHPSFHPQLQPLMHVASPGAFQHGRQTSHPLEHLYTETGLAPLTYSDLHRHEAQQQQQMMQHSASAGVLLPRVAAPAPAYSPSASADLHTLQLHAENDALIMQQQYRLQLAHQQEQQALEQQQAAAAMQLQLQQQQALMRQQLLAAQSVASYPLSAMPVQLAPVALPPPQPQPQLPPPPPPQPVAPAQQHPAIGTDTMAQLTSLLLAQLLAAQANGGPSSLHNANLLAQGARLPPVSARVHPMPQQPAAAVAAGKKKTQVGWNAAVAPLGSPQQQANAVQLGGNPETRSLSADLVIAQTRQDAAMSKHVQRAAQRKLAEAAHAAALAAEDAAAKAKRDADFNKRLMAQRRARARLDAGHERVKAAALTAEVAQMHSLGLIGDGSAAHPFKFQGPQNGRSQAALGSPESQPQQQAREPQPYIDLPMHRTPAPRARDRPRSPRTEPQSKQVPRLYMSPPPRKPHRQTDGPANFFKFSGGGGTGARGLLGVFSTYESDRGIPGRGQQMTWIQKWTKQQRDQARGKGTSPLRALKAESGAGSPRRFKDPSEFKQRAQQRSESVEPPSSKSGHGHTTNQRTRSRPRSHTPPRTQRSARWTRESPRRKEQTRTPPRSRARTPPRLKEEPAPTVVSPAKTESFVSSPATPQPIPSPATPIAVSPAPAAAPVPALASAAGAPALPPAFAPAPAPTPGPAPAPAPAPAAVVVAITAPPIVVSPVAASPKPNLNPSLEQAPPVQPAVAPSSLQQAREEYAKQIAVLEAAKQGREQDSSSSRRSRSRTEKSRAPAAAAAHHSPRPEAVHSDEASVKAAATFPAVVSPSPPSPPATQPPHAALRSSDELLTATTAHASMFPDSGGTSTPSNRQLSTASSSSGSSSHGLTEFHKLIKQKSVAQRVVHEDGTDEIITTTTTVHRNSTALNNSHSHSRAISRNQSISLNSSGSMPLLLDSLESAPYASVSRTRSLRIQAPPSPLGQATPQLQSIPGTPPTPPQRSTHLSPMRHLMQQQQQGSSPPGAVQKPPTVTANAPAEYNPTSVSPHAAAAVAAITEQALLRRASSILVAPAEDEAIEENEDEVAARTLEKERSLLRRKQTYNFEIEDMPEEEHSPRSRSASGSDSERSNSGERERLSPAKPSHRSSQRHVAGGKSNPLLRGVPATLANPARQHQQPLRASHVVAGTGSSATPVKGSSPRHPSRSSPNRSPNRSPGGSAKQRSKPTSSATSTAHQKASVARKYEVAPHHQSNQQSRPLRHKPEEEEKQQQPPHMTAVAAKETPTAVAAASSTASISTTISDDSDLSGGDYSDDVFVALSARGTEATAVVSVADPVVASSPPLKRVDPVRPGTASSIKSEAQVSYSDDEYAEESVQEVMLASPRSKNLATAAAHADPDQSVEEEDFTL